MKRRQKKYLDTSASHDVIGLLKVIAGKYQQTLIVITHDLDIAQMADRTVRLQDGKILKAPSGDTFMSEISDKNREKGDSYVGKQ